MLRNPLTSILVAVFLATGCVASHAGDHIENDSSSINHAKIPMTQAISSAEKQVGGRVVKAKYFRNDNAGVYEIEIASGIKAFDVKVDANNGNIISSTEETPDYTRNKKYHVYDGRNKEESWR